MLDAKNRGDFDTYLRILAKTELFIRTHKEYEGKVLFGEKETHSTPNFSIRGDPRTFFLGYTRGLFPNLDHEVLRVSTVEKISEIGAPLSRSGAGTSRSRMPSSRTCSNFPAGSCGTRAVSAPTVYCHPTTSSEARRPGTTVGR